jgi:hypothetical protein
MHRVGSKAVEGRGLHHDQPVDHPRLATCPLASSSSANRARTPTAKPATPPNPLVPENLPVLDAVLLSHLYGQ